MSFTITPIVKHNPKNKKPKDKCCQIAGCKNEMHFCVFNEKSCFCSQHTIDVDQRRSELKFVYEKWYNKLTDYFAHFKKRETSVVYLNKPSNTYFSVSSEFEFAYLWFLFTKWDRVEECLQINGIYDLPNCLIFDLICAAIQRDIIKNIKSGNLVRVATVPEGTLFFPKVAEKAKPIYDVY